METAAGVVSAKTFHVRPDCRQKSSLRNSGVGAGGQNLILRCSPEDSLSAIPSQGENRVSHGLALFKSPSGGGLTKMGSVTF